MLDKSLIKKSYYKSTSAKAYYEENQEKINNRSKKRWAELSLEEKQNYYKKRKIRRLKRKLKELIF